MREGGLFLGFIGLLLISVVLFIYLIDFIVFAMSLVGERPVALSFGGILFFSGFSLFRLAWLREKEGGKK